MKKFLIQSIVLLFFINISAIYASPPNWTNPTGMQYSMVVHAQVQFNNGTFINSGGSLIAAFKNGECRAVEPVYSGPAGSQFQLTVMSNLATDTIFELKIYDALTDSIYNIQGSFNFADNNTIGAINSPVIYTIESSPTGNNTNWTNPSGMQYSMVLHAQVRFNNGTFITTTGSLLAAFRNGECRAVESIFLGPAGSQFQLTIMSNLAIDTDFDLKIYDALTDSVYNIQETFDFVDNNTIGTINNPVIYTIESQQTGNSPNWTNPIGLQYSMTIHAIAQFCNGNIISESGSLIGAFKDSVCMGFVENFVGPAGNQFILSVMSDLVFDTDFYIKIYDVFSDSIYDINGTFNFTADTTFGQIQNPIIYTISAASPLSVDTIVVSDYNGFEISCFGSNDGSINLSVSGGETPYYFSWNNGEITEDINNITAGEYSVTVFDLCNDTIIIPITLYEPLEVVDSQFIAICNGEIYFAGGANQTITGIYTDVLTTIDGCDSTILTNLTVNPVYTTNVDVEICDGESYFAGGANQTVTGIYTDVLTTVDGCDSTILTNLTVNAGFSSSVDTIICFGENYFAGGSNQTITGVYIDVSTTISGCDSTITTNLTVSQTLPFTEDFEVLPLSEDWVLSSASGSSGWETGASSSWLVPPGSSGIAISDDDFYGCDTGPGGSDTCNLATNDLIILPVFDLSSYTSVNFSFNSLLPNLQGFGISDGYLLGRVDGGSWSILTNIPYSTTWQTINYELPVEYLTCYVEFAFQHNDNGLWSTLFAIDDLEITGSTLSHNLSLNSLVSPSLSICGSTSEFITILIENVSVEPEFNFPVSFQLDGQTPVTEIIIDTIFPGAFLEYTFTQTADFSGQSTYNLLTYVGLVTDQNTQNDSLNSVISILPQISTFPFVEDFESGTIDMFSIFASSESSIASFTDGQNTMIEMQGGSPSGWVSVNSGTVWTENATHISQLISKCAVDGTSSILELLIDLRQEYSNGIAANSWFRVLINGTQISAVNGQTNFQAQDPQNDIFETKVFDLSPYSNTSFEITFESSCNSVFDKVFIDNIIFQESTKDLGVVSLLSPVSGCNLQNQQVSVELENFGFTNVSGFDIYYSVNGGMAVQETVNAVLSGGSVYIYDFTATANFTQGTNELTVWLSFTDDTNANNDSLLSEIIYQPEISTFAYNQDFENAQYWVSGGSNSSWELGQSSNGTQSWGSNLSGNYNNFENSWLLSPCFNFAGMSAPMIEFSMTYHIESPGDSAVIQITTDFGQTWQTLGDSAYYDNLGMIKWSGISNGWKDFSLNLANYSGISNVKFRILFGSDYGDTESGIEIDDIQIFDNSGDIGVLSLISPISICHGDTSLITIELKNFSTDKIFAIGDTLPVNYAFDGNFISEEIVLMANFLPGDTLVYSFINPQIFTSTGNIVLYTSLFDDINPGNDTINETITVNPIYTTNVDVEICNGESYFAAGANQIVTGIYTDILTTVDGCDSTILTNLTVNPVYTTNVDVAICDGESYFAAGANQTVTGIYTDILTSVDGCDSTILTNLTVNPIYTTNVDVAICDGESYFAAGANQTITGIYTDILTTIDGCDSTILTNLTVNPVYTTNVDVAICDGESYFAAGANQTVSGIYTDVLTSVDGCDSTILTNLTVNPVYTTNVDVAICDGETYFAAGANQTVSGIYTDVLITVDGCDSTIITNLTVYQSVNMSISTINVSCFGLGNGSIDIEILSGAVPINYLWSNDSTSQDINDLVAGIYVVTIYDSNGCDEIFSYQVTEPTNPLEISGIVTPISYEGFSDGAIDISVSGGSSPYTFLWSNSETTEDIANLPEGTYEIQVTDSQNCTAIGIYTITTTSLIDTLTLTIVPGWNWISFNVLPLNDSINNVLQNYSANDNDQLVSQANFATFGYGQWWAPSFIIESGKMYKLYNGGNNIVTFDVIGYPVDINQQINIYQGWTWIGYNPQISLDISTALASLNTNDNDQIISQLDGFATYGYGQWWGLTAGMFPGKGYKLYSGFADTLVYPSGTVNLAKSHIEDEFYSIEGWTCEKGMRNTMPIVAQVCFTEGDFIISEGSKLAVFKDNKCRGVSEMIECTSGHIFQLPLMSDETGETGFEFKVFDASSGNIYTAQETLSFENNSKLGTIQNPVLFTISVSNLSQLQNLTNSLGENTPNPFSETTTIPFVLAESGKVLIEIFDNTGKKLLSLTDALYQKGKHQIVWDIRDKDGKFVSDGVYFYRMKTKEFICSGRMIIIE